MNSTESAEHGGANDPFALARRLKTPIWVFDIDRSRVTCANAAACRMWRADSEAELKGRDLSRDMSPTVAERLRQYQRDFLRGDTTFSEFWTYYPDGTPISAEIVVSPFVMPDGRMAMICEVTGAADDEPQTVRSAEALLHTDVMITLYAIDGPPLYTNPAALRAMPDSETPFHAMFCNLQDYRDMQSEWLKTGGCRRVAEMNTVNGTRWFDLTVKRTPDAATGEQALLVTAVDVSDLKTARDKARYLADRDQLTGCFNRAFITQRLELIAAGRNGADRSCAVLFLDIDNFKHVNDRFGHEAGDFLLKTFAQRVQSRIRQSDTIARMGGDEFIVLIEDVRDLDAVYERLEAIQTEVTRPIAYGASRLNITTSIGISMVQAGSALDWSEIIKQADIALYSSKRSGRNRHTFFNDALGAQVAEQNWLESELQKAIDAQALTLHFQPRIDLRSCKVVAAEALLRWNHDERGYIEPERFIPVSENTGLIHDFGSRVVQQGFAQLRDWRRRGIDLDVSINVSPVQLQHPGLIETYAAIADASPIATDGLELEITAASFCDENAYLTERIRQIADLGFRLTLDHFGTGQSNLVDISRFPLNCIKLDMSFVQQLPESGPLLRLIVSLARQIGATTVAEGVETPEQLAWLYKHGCDQVQGFLFSAAVPEGQFLHNLARAEETARRLLAGDMRALG